jgi:hypothetical protein
MWVAGRARSGFTPLASPVEAGIFALMAETGGQMVSVIAPSMDGGTPTLQPS